MKGKILFLGTGASSGVPLIGCRCKVCLSDDAHNKRLRSSSLLSIGGKKLLIDTGPDFRYQALHHKIDHLDGVLFTHSHYDHIAGIDELRRFYVLNQKALPVLISSETLKELKLRYYYLFQEKNTNRSCSAQLDFVVLPEKRGNLEFLGLPIRYMTYHQGEMQITGFRLGKFAYVSDIKDYPETIFQDLEGVETLILSALKMEASPLHLSVEEAVSFAKKVKAKQTFLVHMTHDLDHKETNRLLPSSVSLAYDGLEVEFSYD